MQDVNNVHLVCRNLHQIANLQVNPKLRIDQASSRNLKSLLQSSRIFQALSFSGSNDFLSCQKQFEMIEDYIGSTGTHVKKLSLDNLEVDQMIVQKLLNLLPNLEAFELVVIKSINPEQSIKLDLKATKIERVQMSSCTDLQILLESLEKCAIRELEFNPRFPSRSKDIKKFLTAQEKNLKKLTGRDCDFYFLADLQGLRLEEFRYNYFEARSVSLEFLKQQVDLRSLHLFIPNSSGDILNTICELRKLECLEYLGNSRGNSAMNNLHKLGKLKILKVPARVSRNILVHLKFGVFEDLVELDAAFLGASSESVQEMSRITPNLKKLTISCASSDTINGLLETLANLEALNIADLKWEITEKVYPKIKYLLASCDEKLSPEQFSFTQQFPNLEYLKLKYSTSKATESFFDKLLKKLKQLKSLCMEIRCDPYCFRLSPEFILRYLENYERHLAGIFRL